MTNLVVSLPRAGAAVAAKDPFGQPSPTASIRPPEALRSAAAWRRFALAIPAEIPWRWLICWLALPNLIIILMWPIGGPSMRPSLLLFGYLALGAAQLPWVWLKRATLLMMIASVSAVYVCLMFNLPVWGIVYWPRFAGEMHLWQVPVYAGAAVLFVAVLALALILAPHTPRFTSRWQWLLAFAAVLGLGSLDTWATASTSDSYHASPTAGQPFTSAAQQTGLNHPPASRHNVVIVLVEALGLPRGKVERQMFDADWGRTSWSRDYEVKSGSIPYYGSTTNAELRALCGRWGRYDSFDFKHADCLPEVYRDAGYATTAIHSFTGSYFDRRDWYPLLHFDRTLFGPDLIRSGVRQCGGLFPGACDQDVPGIIRRLERAGDKPQFIYWLTLNSHLPVIAAPDLGTTDCQRGPRQWIEENPQLCRLFLVHHNLAQAIHALAADPDLPPTDFLIVGDHMPPFFDRERRQRFDGGHVPYVMLKSRKLAR